MSWFLEKDFLLQLNRQPLELSASETANQSNRLHLIWTPRDCDQRSWFLVLYLPTIAFSWAFSRLWPYYSRCICFCVQPFSRLRCTVWQFLSPFLKRAGHGNVGPCLIAKFECRFRQNSCCARQYPGHDGSVGKSNRKGVTRVQQGPKAKLTRPTHLFYLRDGHILAMYSGQALIPGKYFSAECKNSLVRLSRSQPYWGV
jgi:hypothetical protein